MRLNNHVKNFLASFFRKLGYTLEKNKNQYIDTRSNQNSYKMMMFYGKHVIINAPIKKAMWKISPTHFDRKHPFVEALINTKNITNPREAIEKSLQFYYETVQPRTMTECIDGITENKSFPDPRKTHTVHWPWIQKIAVKEFSPVLIKGKIKLLPIEKHGVQHWGPVSKEKLDTEVFKFFTLYNSIKENGFRSNPDEKDGVIRAYVLENDNEDWRWIPIQGQHRVSVAASLDIENVPVKIESVFRKIDLHLFPLVVNGTYTLEEATKVFESFFDGNTPKLLTNWIKLKDKKIENNDSSK